MAILVSDIVSRCASALDAEGNDYYLFDQDYRPAILSAQDFIVSVINSQLGKKKMSEEIFADLTLARVFQASNFSRIRLDPSDSVLGHDVWTILAVAPLPTTSPVFVTQPLVNPQDSKYRNDLAYVSSEFFCQRLTAEEWEVNIKNPFADGHNPESGETPNSYAYLNYSNYTASGYTLVAPAQEIEIRPSIANLGCMIRYVRVPVKPTLISDSIQFPAFTMDIIVEATQLFLSQKQGDQTTLSSLSERFLQMIVIPNQ